MLHYKKLSSDVLLIYYLQVKSLLDTFLKDIAIAAEEFIEKAPYAHENNDTKQAFAAIEESKDVSESV